METQPLVPAQESPLAPTEIGSEWERGWLWDAEENVKEARAAYLDHKEDEVKEDEVKEDEVKEGGGKEGDVKEGEVKEGEEAQVNTQQTMAELPAQEPTPQDKHPAPTAATVGDTCPGHVGKPDSTENEQGKAKDTDKTFGLDVHCEGWTDNGQPTKRIRGKKKGQTDQQPQGSECRQELPPRPSSFGKAPCISPEEQCPAKKRGRKAKQDKEKDQKEAKGSKRGRSKVKTTSENVSKSRATTRKSRKSDVAAKEQHAAEATEHKGKPKGTTTQDGTDGNNEASQRPSDRMRKHLQEAKRKRLAEEQNSKHEEDQLEKGQDEQTEQANKQTGDKPSKRSRKSTADKEEKEGTKDNAEDDKVVVKKPRSRASKKDDKTAHKKDKAAKAKVGNRGGGDQNGGDEGDAPPRKVRKTRQRSAEAKAKLSRKSAAYHKTYTHTVGSEEEKRTAAKKVTLLNTRLYRFWALGFGSSLKTIYICAL